MTKHKMFYECGCCGMYHPAQFNGDCRDDANRYAPEDLPDGWEEMRQEELDPDATIPQ